MPQPLRKISQLPEIDANAAFDTGNGTRILGFNTTTRLLEPATIDLSAYATAASVTTALAAKEPAIAGGTSSQYWRGDKTWQTLDKAAVGLSNVLNSAQEPALGNPASNGQVLASTTSGTRSWVTLPTSGISQNDGDARYLQLSGGVITGQTRVSHIGDLPNTSAQDALRIQPSGTKAANYRGWAIYPNSTDTVPVLWTDTNGNLQGDRTDTAATLIALKRSGLSVFGFSYDSTYAGEIIVGYSNGSVRTGNGTGSFTINAGNYNNAGMIVHGKLSLSNIATSLGYGSATDYPFDSNRGSHRITGSAATNATWFANRFGVVTVSGHSAPQTVTDAATMRIDGPPTAGSLATLTNVYALWVANGISRFGGQVRCATLGVGNSANATTPGTVVKKVEIFDVSGTSLGYVPVYDAIS